MRFSFVFFLLVLCNFLSSSQNTPEQIIRGTVTDQVSGQPLAYVSIVLSGTSSGTMTDQSGNFILSHVQVGRYTLQVSMIGYEPYQIKELQVTSGKEIFLNIGLKENVTALSDVVVKPRISKNLPVNRDAMASARMLSVEEATRYAGGFDDPARLVTSFAGVASQVGNNSIIVRGNNPQSLQWKMEGIEIPNPNHFADLAAFGGGGLTALSSQLLGNSDFLTGAMPAEYSNALAGVFDIYMRNGNNRKSEHTFQTGLLGIDAASEGPLRKEGKSSYLFNYRYSTLGLLEPILPENAGGTNYQDLSFKLNFPVNPKNTISLFGIGLSDRSGAEAKTDSSVWQYETDRERMDVRQYMGAGGITHRIRLNSRQNLKSTLATTVSGIHLETDKLIIGLVLRPENRIRNINQTIVLTSVLNSKFNARHSNKTGFTATRMIFNMETSHSFPPGSQMHQIVDENGKSTLIAAYSHSSLRISEKFSLNIGINAQWMDLNNRFSAEPRMAIKYEPGSHQALSMAYGLHSRLERLNYYFVKDAAGNRLNPHLGFSKAHQLVLGYEAMPSETVHIKLEAYAQWLFDIPVIPDSSFSLINQQNDWLFGSKLENTGKGRNIGIELTAEKYLTNGFYWMATASLFKSTYLGGDRLWRDTRFNRNYLLNFLAGKEWNTGRFRKNNVGLNARLSFMGGENYSPADPGLSALRKIAVTDETHAFSQKLSPALVAHFTGLYRINRKKASHEFALKIINLTRYKDFQGFQYNLQTGRVDMQREEVFIPNLSWKVEF